MAKHTIKLKKYLDVIVEYVAVSTITPGMLIELTSAGKVQAHASAGQNVAPVMFALEDELQGNDIDDDYSADDPVQCWVAQRGEEVYAILEDGENISIGDKLESAGNGNLQKYTADTEAIGADSSAGVGTIYTNQIVAIALEAKNLSASSGAESSGIQGDQRIMVRVV